MKFCIIFLNVIFLSNLFYFTLASYEPPYGPAHSSGPPIGGSSQGWNSGQAVGSYYHYHVPLVGQQGWSHYPQQQSQGTDLHHILLWLIPLFLLLIGAVALLPLLLKFLLLPIGLSLLAILLPLLMMGGMMMMMMMMGMMGGGGMMMMMRNGHPQVTTTASALGQMLINDWSSVASSVSRSIEFDQCPEKLACQLGSMLYGGNANDNTTMNIENGEVFSKYVIEQLLPRGKVKKTVKLYKEAFWTGSKLQSCESYKCQPSLKLFQNENNKKYGMKSEFYKKYASKVNGGDYQQYQSQSNSTTFSTTEQTAYVYRA